MYKRSQITGRSIEEVIRSVNAELQKIEQYTIELESEVLQLKETTVQPKNPTTPTIAIADGVSWNPGQGAGPYYWNGTEWLPLITPPDGIPVPKARLRLVGFPPTFNNTSQRIAVPKATLRFTSYSVR